MCTRAFRRLSLLPAQNEMFDAVRKSSDLIFVVKLDAGALGRGIVLLHRNDEYVPIETGHVAQTYIESCLFCGKKIDLRIYVLVTSVDLLEIYVYRDGVVRICSDEYTTGTKEASLTNVSVNRKNACSDMSSISKLISEVFPDFERNGVDVHRLWKRIDRVIALSIIAGSRYLRDGVARCCPKTQYSRCFQILCFDVLLDKSMKPHVLEVNYRPMLDYYRGSERRMKVSMIRDAILIGAPVTQVQTMAIIRRWFDSKVSWDSVLASLHDLQESINEVKSNALEDGLFELILPAKSNRAKELFDKCILLAQSMPIEALPGFRPRSLIGEPKDARKMSTDKFVHVTNTNSVD